MEKLLTNRKTYFLPECYHNRCSRSFIKNTNNSFFLETFGKIEVRFYRIKQNFKIISQAYTGPPPSYLR